MEITAEQIRQLFDFSISQSGTLKTVLFDTSLPPVSKGLINQAIQIPRLFGINQYLRNNINTNTRGLKTAVRHSNCTRILATHQRIMVPQPANHILPQRLHIALHLLERAFIFTGYSAVAVCKFPHAVSAGDLATFNFKAQHALIAQNYKINFTEDIIGMLGNPQ